VVHDFDGVAVGVEAERVAVGGTVGEPGAAAEAVNVLIIVSGFDVGDPERGWSTGDE